MGRQGEFDGITDFWEANFLTGRHEIMKYMKGRHEEKKGMERGQELLITSCEEQKVWGQEEIEFRGNKRRSRVQLGNEAER